MDSALSGSCGTLFGRVHGWGRILVRHSGPYAYTAEKKSLPMWVDEVTITVIGSGFISSVAIKKLEERIMELTQLRHPNIVHYLGCFAEDVDFGKVFVIVQDFKEGESLKERLAKNSNGLGGDVSLDTLIQALLALDYVYDHGVAHGNITPNSLWFCSDGTVRLTNFCLPQWWSNLTVSPASLLFLDYLAPANYPASSYGNSFMGDMQNDIFSMGIVMHEMFIGLKPYRAENSLYGDACGWMRRSVECGKGKKPISVIPCIECVIPGATGVIARSLIREKKVCKFFRIPKCRGDVSRSQCEIRRSIENENA